VAIVLYQVDAFTLRPFAGNPAGVCVLTEPRDDHWLQSVAAEMNLAETAFLWRRGPRDFDLRWFTPAVEVDLCGHATLASAHILWELGLVSLTDPIGFHTLSGILTSRLRANRIEMDFPAEPPAVAPTPPELVQALGVEPTWVGRNRHDYLLLLDSEEQVRKLAPDMAVLQRVETRGVIVTARAQASRSCGIDFVSRFFAPRAGVNEDPVTGSAHCCLGPFWQEKLQREELVGYQASRRGGIVHVRTAGDRVLLGGQAVTVLRCELLVEM
jgi:PhzF family phenazine biosynthesis protein